MYLGALSAQEKIALRNAARAALDEDFSGLTSAARMSLAIQFVNSVGDTWSQPISTDAVRSNPAYSVLVAKSSTAAPMMPDFIPVSPAISLPMLAAGFFLVYMFMKGKR